MYRYQEIPSATATRFCSPLFKTDTIFLRPILYAQEVAIRSRGLQPVLGLGPLVVADDEWTFWLKLMQLACKLTPGPPPP